MDLERNYTQTPSDRREIRHNKNAPNCHKQLEPRKNRSVRTSIMGHSVYVEGGKGTTQGSSKDIPEVAPFSVLSPAALGAAGPQSASRTSRTRTEEEQMCFRIGEPGARGVHWLVWRDLNQN